MDTDVLVSALRSSTGASRLLLSAAGEGAVLLIVSVAITFEYEAVLKRPGNLEAMGLTTAGVDEILDNIIRVAELVVPGEPVPPRIQDRDDEKFVDAFVSGHADAIATFNLRDYYHADRRLASQAILAVPAFRPGDIIRRISWPSTLNSPFGSLPR